MDAESILLFLVSGGFAIMMAVVIGWWVLSILTGRPLPTATGPEPDAKGLIIRRCRKCGYDLRGIVGRCPECGIFNVDRAKYFQSLNSDWPEQATDPRVATPEENRELLLSTSNPMEADFIQQQLNSRGIYCAIEEETFGEPFLGNHRTCFQLLVYSNDRRAALEFLRHAKDLPPDATDEELIGPVT